MGSHRLASRGPQGWCLYVTAAIVASLTVRVLGFNAFAASTGNRPAIWSLLEQLPAEAVANLTSKQLHLRAADVDELLEKHEQHLGLHLRNTKYLASKDWSDFDAISEGAWLELPEGGTVWSLKLHCHDVPSHMILFSEVWLVEGSELLIFSEAATAGLTECERSCMRLAPQDVPPSGRLTTVPIEGDTVTIMYYQPQPLGGAHYPKLTILHAMQDVSRRLLPTQQLRRRRKLLQEEGSTVVGTYLPVLELQQNVSTVAACTPSIECYPEFAPLAAGVVAVYAVDPASKTIGICTGSLINAPKNNIFLLTAHHCLRSQSHLVGFEYWLMIFNYNAPCGYNLTSVPRISQVIQGVRIAFYNSDADVLLLNIRNAIPNYFKAYLLGFDASPNAVPTSAVGIQHPSGAPTAIATATAGGISTNFSAPNFPPGEVQPTDLTHIQVTWATGATAPGSSGSPLIDTASGKVVGILTGGYTSCQDRTQSDYYGRLSRAWDAGLYQYLATGMLQLPKGSSFAGPETVSLLLNDNTNAGRPNPMHGPSMGFFPTVLHFLPNDTSQNTTYYLLDPPAAGETVTINVSMIPLQGNAIDIRPLVQLEQGVFNYTLEDFGKHFTTFVNITDYPSPVPGNLLRFDILVNVTSTKMPDMYSLLTLKGLIQDARTKWTDVEPIVISQLPFYAKYPISSPSGKAVFKFTNKEGSTSEEEVDVVVCRFPEPDDLPLADGTVTAYRSGTFIWTQTPYDDPFGSLNCVYVPRTKAHPKNTYYIVVSDQDDLDAVKNISTIQQVYFGYSNSSIAASLL